MRKCETWKQPKLKKYLCASFQEICTRLPLCSVLLCCGTWSVSPLSSRFTSLSPGIDPRKWWNLENVSKSFTRDPSIKKHNNSCFKYTGETMFCSSIVFANLTDSKLVLIDWYFIFENVDIYQWYIKTNKVFHMYSYTLSRENRVTGNRYSRLLFTIAMIKIVPICAYKNNRRIWRHNAITLCSHRSSNVVTSQW